MTTLSLDDAQGESHAQHRRQRAPAHAQRGAQLQRVRRGGSEPNPSADADGGLVTCAKSVREYPGGAFLLVDSLFRR
jgi:hypothetical protein